MTERELVGRPFLLLPSFWRKKLAFRLKMPVSGLPTALEAAVNALLQQHSITSWKISADGEKNPVVILRLTEFTHLQGGKDNSEVSKSTCPQLQYRRKPPSQVRRDRRRAEERRNLRTKDNQKQASDDESVTFHSCLFKKTPPLGKHTTQQEADDVSMSQPCIPPARARAARRVDGDTDSEHSRQAGDSPVTCTASADFNDSDSDIDQQTVSCKEDPRDPTEVTAREAGYKLDVIKECVSGITDRRVQSNIRDKTRNTSVGKVVQFDGDPDRLLCDSDDIVAVVSSNGSDCGIVRYLFVKQTRKYMCDHDLRLLSQLQQSEPLQRSEHEDKLKLSEKYLQILLDTMRHYLG